MLRILPLEGHFDSEESISAYDYIIRQNISAGMNRQLLLHLKSYDFGKMHNFKGLSGSKRNGFLRTADINKI